MAHELRNMLASASSSIFLAKRDLDKRDRLLGHLDAAEAELHRSQDVIDRVLRLVRGEPIHREMCRLTEVVTAAKQNVRSVSVRIDTDVVPDELEVSCEPLLVERLLTNLLSNAVEAMAAVSSGTIVVRGRTTKHGFVIAVEDNGPGFAAEVLQRLFQPGVTTKSTGTGLGLLLCRSIVRVHGGDMQVERSAMGGALIRCEFG